MWRAPVVGSFLVDLLVEPLDGSSLYAQADEGELRIGAPCVPEELDGQRVVWKEAEALVKVAVQSEGCLAAARSCTP